jgi:glutathione S-transferase
MTLADICLFAYTHVAGDAEFDLKRYPHVVQWIERVKGQPRYIAMIS